MTNDWRLDGVLNPALRFPERPSGPSEPEAVLLTGATGMLGAFVLAELLRETEAVVCCLVREEAGTPASARLRSHLDALGLWEPRHAGRIVVIKGDLGCPGLGLSPEAFDALAARVGAIYHCGVMAHFLRPYAAHRAVNVGGTAELLRLAATGLSKSMHHVSTLAVFFDREGYREETVSERDQPAPDGLRSGYVRSKWVSEQQVYEAMRRGLPATIYRTSRITGHSQTGATSGWGDLLTRMLKASVLLGEAPSLPIDVSMMPVDHVARTIVYLSRDPRALGRAFHLFQPEPIAWSALTTMITAEGAPLREVPYDEWRDRVKQAAKSDHPDRESFARLWMLLGPDSALLGERPRHDTPESRLCLEGSGIVCPRIDQTLVRCYLGFFRQRGFIP